jgi:hypothetical protein
MIDAAFLNRIGLNEDQVKQLTDAMNCESRYRQILLQEGVNPKTVEPIIRATRLDEVDFTNEPLLRMKVKSEWSDFIK